MYVFEQFYGDFFMQGVNGTKGDMGVKGDEGGVGPKGLEVCSSVYIA